MGLIPGKGGLIKEASANSWPKLSNKLGLFVIRTRRRRQPRPHFLPPASARRIAFSRASLRASANGATRGRTVYYLAWDASGLAKRYGAEQGSATVNALFAQTPPALMVTTILTYCETYSVLLRTLHRGQIRQQELVLAESALAKEVIDDADFVVLGLEYNDFLQGLDLIRRHHLKSSDAAILQALLRFAQSQATVGATAVVASDQRLLRAASAEGLHTLNPETLAASDVAAFLASL